MQRGAQLYAQTCATCHGRSAVGGVKDLRHMTADTHAKFGEIVLGGIYLEKGMASFADLLDQQQVFRHPRLPDRPCQRGLGRGRLSIPALPVSRLAA